jgi:hypothetical protein
MDRRIDDPTAPLLPAAAFDRRGCGLFAAFRHGKCLGSAERNDKRR